MLTPESCLVLRKAGNDQLVVTADFAATGRTTATFHDLTERLHADCTIWEIAPVPYGQERGMTGTDQVDRWVGDIRRSGLLVRAVVGFCGGNAYAAALAERVARWQDPPLLVLLDPGIPRPHMLGRHVEGWLRRYAGSFAPDQLSAARADVAAAAAPGEQPLALAARLGELFGRTVAPALVRAGHSTRAADDFTRLVTGYLHWLAGATQLDPRPLWRTAPALNSNSPDFGLFLAPPRERATLVGSVRYFDVAHADLMRDGGVAAAVDELLAGERLRSVR